MFIRILSEGLVSKGVEVVLVTENGSGRAIEGVRETPIPTPGLDGIDLLAYSAAFVAKAQRLFRGVDVIHVHSPGSNIVLGAWAAKTFRIPLAVTVHSMAAAGPRWMWALRRADALIVVSPSLRGRLVEAGVDPDTICVIPSASSRPSSSMPQSGTRSRLGFQPEDVVFLYHGRLVPGKGLHELAEAFRSLTCPQARLLVVGDGPVKSFLQDRLAGLIASRRALLIGAVPHEAIWDFLAAADVAVLPSKSEGSPLALFEALSAGLPVLATDAPGLRDFVTDEENGVLVPIGDPTRLQEAMERLVAGESFRRRLSEGARRSADRYSIEACTNRHIEVYRKLARGE